MQKLSSYPEGQLAIQGHADRVQVRSTRRRITGLVTRTGLRYKVVIESRSLKKVFPWHFWSYILLASFLPWTKRTLDYFKAQELRENPRVVTRITHVTAASSNRAISDDIQ